MVKVDKNSGSAKRAPIEAVIATDRLVSRPYRTPDYKAETEVLRKLSRKLSESPQNALNTLVEEAMRVCGAESAGVSIAEIDHTGEIFRWHAVAGKLSPFLSATMPRE